MPALALAPLGMATRLILIRHTEPAAEFHGRCYGRTDAGLSPHGVEHAAGLARALAGLAVDAVLCSPRRRTLETAQPIAAALGLPVTCEPDLAELDFGEFEGRAYADIAREHPDFWAQWMAAPTTVQFPGGESHADLKVRVTRAMSALRAREEQQSTMIVSHGGIIKTVLAATLGLPDEHMFRLDQRYGAVNVVDWFGEEPVLRLLNG